MDRYLQILSQLGQNIAFLGIGHYLSTITLFHRPSLYCWRHATFLVMKNSCLLGEMARFSLVTKTFENVDILRQNGAFFGGIRVPSTSKLVVWFWPVDPELWSSFLLLLTTNSGFTVKN